MVLQSSGLTVVRKSAAEAAKRVVAVKIAEKIDNPAPNKLDNLTIPLTTWSELILVSLVAQIITIKSSATRRSIGSSRNRTDQFE